MEHLGARSTSSSRRTRSCASAATEIGRDPPTIERTVDRRPRDPRHPRGGARAYKAILEATARSSTRLGRPRRARPAEIADGLRPIIELGFRHVLIDMPAPVRPGDARPDRRGGRAAQRVTRRSSRLPAGSAARSSPTGSPRTSATPHGRRQHRRRLRAPRAARDARPRHRPLQPRRDRAGRVGLGHRGRHPRDDGPARPPTARRLVLARRPRPRAAHRPDRAAPGGRPSDGCLPRRSSSRSGSRRASCPWPTTRSRPRSGPPTAGSSSRSTSSTGARRPTCSRCGFAGVASALPSPEVVAALEAAEAIVDLALQPARLGRADPRRARFARRRVEGARAGASRRGGLPDHRRQGAEGTRGPDARRRWATRPRRWASRASTPTSSTCSCSTPWTRTLAPAVEALGLRPVVTDTIMTDDASRARLAGIVLEAVGHQPT